jgi:hypothetical protein
MASNHVDILERQESLDKLVKSGYRDMIEAFLLNESKVYTKKGRLNKSGACRVLGWKTKQLEDAFNECRKILGYDIF